MRIYTGSTSCDDRATRGKNRGKIMVNLKENVREEKEINRLNDQCEQYGKPPHYDLEKAQRNIVYENCLTTEEAFMYVMGEAMESFNASQKRNDRKTSLEKELEKLEKGKVKQELIHTLIVQVGNKDSRPSEEECVEILKEYLEQFRERFPNMRIVSAAIHLDEDTPHLQLYYIPVKTREQHEAAQPGKKWSGMDVQPSLKGALEQMGYSNDATVLVKKKDENGEVILGDDGEPVLVKKHDYQNGAMAQWQKDFNGLLDEICLKHDIELDHYQRGQKVSHQDTLDFQEGRIQRDINAAKDELETVQLFTKEERQTLQEVEDKKKTAERDLEALKGKYDALESKLNEAETREEAAKQRADREEQRADRAEKKAARAEKRAEAAEEREKQAESAIDRLMKMVGDWLDAHHGLERILRTAVRLSPFHREKIERRKDEDYERGGKAILEARKELTVESLLEAANEVERGKRTLDILKTATKNDLDPDDLEDGWER